MHLGQSVCGQYAYMYMYMRHYYYHYSVIIEMSLWVSKAPSQYILFIMLRGRLINKPIIYKGVLRSHKESNDTC